jgi:hypothetical protein
MSTNSSLPPSGDLPPGLPAGFALNVGTINQMHVTSGTNAQSTSQSKSTSSVEQSISQSFVWRLASHGWGYWALHFVLALLAAAAFELLVWHFHWMGH